MKIIFLVVVAYSALVPIIDSRKYRAIARDELLEYELDKSVPNYPTYFSNEYFILEEIGDDTVLIGGYIDCIKSMDRNMPIIVSFRSQYYQNSRWNEGMFQLTMNDGCKEYTNPTRFWYNITKLWTSDKCPPQKGDKWFIENQTHTCVMDVPTVPLVPWRVYIKVFQGTPGFEKRKFGFGIQLEIIPV